MFKNHYVEKSQTKKNVVYDSWNNTLTKWILKAYYPVNRCRKDHWQNPTSIHDKTLSKQYMLLLSHFSRVRLCVTPWTAAHQASPSLGFSRQEHWSGLPFPSPLQLLEVLNGWTLGQNVTIKYFLLSLFLATYSLLLIQHLFNISGTQMSNDSF